MNSLFLLSLEKGTAEKFSSVISKRRLQEAERFRFKADHDRHILAEVLLRYVICSRTKVKNAKIQLAARTDGKPYLINNSDFFFNLSHSGSWVSCGISNQEVGVDIEECRDFIEEDDLLLAKRFFHPAEYAALLEASSLEEKQRLFFQFWTLKESFIKYTGKGLQTPLDSFYFSIDERIRIHPAQDKELYFFSWLMKEYRLSFCSELNEMPEFHFVDANQLTTVFN